jgi:phage terminase large subunit-like protein
LKGSLKKLTDIWIPKKSNKKKTVEDYLNEVSYDLDPSYSPTIFAMKFVNFIKLVNGTEGEENLTPILHYKMLDVVASEHKLVANMVHRGAAKTTLFGEYMALYIATFQELPYLPDVSLSLYVSDSIENGIKNMRKNLEFRWENSEFLQKFVPEARFTDIRWEFTNADNKKMVMKGYGAKTGVRGAKEMGKRPTLAILDDLISDEDARSETVIKSIEDTVYKAVSYALHPKASKIFWSGTPFNQRDPLYKAVTSGGWVSNVYPVCEQFPCSKEEFKGSWPDRFTYEFVLEKYTLAMQTGEISSFNQELMLRIMSAEDRLITDSDICWYSREAVMSKRSNFNFYITTDFATSEKTAADYSVISVWAVNNVGSWFWVDGLCKRQTMDKNIDSLFGFVSMYKPYSVGVEVSGQQGGFVSFIQKEMITRNVFFNLASENNDGKAGLRPNTNKMQRFNIVVPLFKAKKIYFPEELRDSPEMAECMNELTLASAEGFKSKHDDFIDTISMLGSIKPALPSENTKSLVHIGNGVFQEEEEVEEYGGLDSYLV